MAEQIDSLPYDVERYLEREESILAPDADEARPEDHYDAPAVDRTLALGLMRRYARIQRDGAEHVAAIDAEIARLQQARSEVEAVTARRLQPIADLLTLYHRNRLAEDPKAKTIDLAPYGKLAAREHKEPTVRLADREAVMAWAADNAPEFVKHKPELDWAKLKGCIYVDPQRRPVNVTTGEVVPGVAVEEPRVEFNVKVADS